MVAHPEKHPMFLDYNDRVRTFPPQLLGLIPRTKEAIAEAGFFFDQVAWRFICFHCGVEISNFHELKELTPYEFHAKYNKDCRFMIQIKGSTYTLATYLSLNSPTDIGKDNWNRLLDQLPDKQRDKVRAKHITPAQQEQMLIDLVKSHADYLNNLETENANEKTT
jgi:Inhibitor of Apoptosis domain